MEPEPSEFGRALEQVKEKLMGKPEPIKPKISLEELKEAVTPEAKPEKPKEVVLEAVRKVPLGARLKEGWSGFATGFGATGFDGLRKHRLPVFSSLGILIAFFLGFFLYEPSMGSLLGSLILIIGTIFVVIGAMGFLGFWARKRLVFSVLGGLVVGCLVWFLLVPSLAPLTLLITFVLMAIILGLNGALVVPAAMRDLTRSVKLTTASLAVIFPVIAIMLGFTCALMGPVLSPLPIPAEVGPDEMDIRIDREVMYGYSIKGPVDYNGVKTTRILADRIEVWGMTQVKGEGRTTVPYAEMRDVEIYATYVRGTGEALGMSATSAWHGDDSPPMMVGMLGDPVTMTDVTLRVVGQKVGSISFGQMEVKHGWSLKPENSFKLHADEMELTVTEMDLREGITIAENVRQENMRLEIPQEGGWTLVIEAPHAEVGLTRNCMTLISTLKFGLPHLENLIPMIMGERVVLHDVDMVLEWMEAENVSLSGLRQYVSEKEVRTK